MIGRYGGRQRKIDYGAAADAQLEAARLEAEAHRKNREYWKEYHERIRADNEPWRQIGAQAITLLREGLAGGEFEVGEFKGLSNEDFKKTPGYQFRLNEARKEIERDMAAKGMTGGATHKALLRYSSKYASDEYGRAYGRARDMYNSRVAERDKRFNRLSMLAGTGERANARNAAAGANAAAGITSATLGEATAIGAGRVGAANAEIAEQIAANQASQANINNILGGINAASNVYSIYRGLGVQT